jgi:hypothetical protein
VILRRHSRRAAAESSRENTPAEEWAAEVADVTTLDTDEELQIARRHLEVAKADHGDDELKTLAAAVAPIAAELDKPEPEVAAELAEGSNLVRAYEQWQEKKGLSSWPAPDRRRAAHEAVRYLDRRIARLTERLRLARNLTAGQRERLEQDLETLNKEHDDHFAELNPAVLGSAFGGESIRSDQLVSPARHFCRTCEREIDRKQAYHVGHCEPCDQERQLMTGRPLPRI